MAKNDPEIAKNYLKWQKWSEMFRKMFQMRPVSQVRPKKYRKMAKMTLKWPK